MKKNISINISGIIFHIEEDVYERLKSYLESIQKYFSTFDDSTEILEDIESRIAEIFLSKLNEDKQIIIDEDVDQLIKTMGNISDFEAVEEPEDDKTDSTASSPIENENHSSSNEPGRKRLHRDSKRKIVGGVVSGISHYMTIDPLWIRLAIALVVFFGIFWDQEWLEVLIPIISITYIILWISVPKSETLEDSGEIKKMFRNPDDKVLGGVASGIGAYFGTSTTLIRLLLVLSIFLAGAGVIFYLIFWVITPEAKTITEKMKMQGEPVTLSGIESTIKENFATKDGEESVALKILLFPFRLIAGFFRIVGAAIGPILLFLVEAIRVIAGILLLIVGIALLFATLVTVSAFIGLIDGNHIEFNGFNFDQIHAWITIPGMIGYFLLLFIPAIAMAIIGASVITKRTLLNAISGWSLFALFVIGLFLTAFSIPSLIGNFAKDGSIKKEEVYDFKSQTAVLRVNTEGFEDNSSVRLKIRGHEDSTFLLVSHFDARGKTRKEAQDNASKIRYNVERLDNVLTFDENISLEETDKFSFHELSMTLFIPYNQPFKLDESIHEIFNGHLSGDAYHNDNFDQQIWIIEEGGSILCTSCPEEEADKDEENSYSRNDSNDYSNGYFIEHDLENIEKIKISGAANVLIKQGKKNSVVFMGNQEIIDAIDINDYGDKLKIDTEGELNFNSNDDRIKIEIIIESLNELELNGAIVATVDGFKEAEMDVKLAGICQAEIEAEIKKLYIDVSGASKLSLIGEGRFLGAQVNGVSKIDAFDFDVDKAEINTSGTAKVEISVDSYLQANASGVSKITYKGDPKLDSNTSGASSIVQD